MRPPSSVFRLLVLLLTLAALTGCRAPDAPHTLTIWSAPTGMEERAFLRLCRRFEREHPGLRVRNVGSLQQEKLTRAIVAGVPPDLAYLYGTSDVGPLAANGALAPLDSLYRRSGFRDTDFLPGCIAQGRYAGRLYAMPVTRDAHALYWNRQVFRRSGLDPNSPPRTVEDLFRLSAVLTHRSPDGSLDRLGFLPIPDDTAMLLCMLGANLTDPGSGRLSLDAPENIAALQTLVSFMDGLGGRAAVGAFKSSFGRQDSAQNPIATGKVAMSLEGEWVAMYMEKYAPQVDYGVGEIPYPASRPKLRNMAWQDGDVMVIPRGATHPSAAWEFIRWMQEPRQQEEYAAAMNNLPAIRSLLGSPEITRGSRKKRALGYILDHIAGASHNPRFFPPLAASRFCRDVLDNAVEQAELHRKTPGQALADAQRRVSVELARYCAP